MRAEDMFQWLDAQPFVPFRIVALRGWSGLDRLNSRVVPSPPNRRNIPPLRRLEKTQASVRRHDVS